MSGYLSSMSETFANEEEVFFLFTAYVTQTKVCSVHSALKVDRRVLLYFYFCTLKMNKEANFDWELFWFSTKLQQKKFLK